MARTRNIPKMKIKIKKRTEENTTSLPREPSGESKRITKEGLKNKFSRIQLQTINEVVRCQEIIKSKQDQRRTLESELQRADQVKWINTGILKSECTKMDLSIVKNTRWIAQLQSANHHIIKILEIFNEINDTTDGQAKEHNSMITDTTDRQANGHNSTDGQTIIISDDEKEQAISSLDAIVQSSEEDPEQDLLIKEALQRQASKAAQNGNTKPTNDAMNSTNTAGPSTTTTYARRTGLPQAQRQPETTTTKFSENDMKIINEKIERYEKMFAKNRQITKAGSTTMTTTTEEPAFYNHGQTRRRQKDKKKQYPPPHIYDRRKRKFTFSFSIEQ